LNCLIFRSLSHDPCGGLIHVPAFGGAHLLANVLGDFSILEKDDLRTAGTLCTRNCVALAKQSNYEVVFCHTPTLTLASTLWKSKLHHYPTPGRVDPISGLTVKSKSLAMHPVDGCAGCRRVLRAIVARAASRCSHPSVSAPSSTRFAFCARSWDPWRWRICYVRSHSHRRQAVPCRAGRRP
jgi:hypothetical protein